MKHMILLAASLVGLTPDLLQASPPAPLRKQPAYQSGTPQYFLLLLGREAPVPVWLVLDGETLYVDRNSNGDLTEEGEGRKVLSRDEDTLTFAVEEGEITGYRTDPLQISVQHRARERRWHLREFVVRKIRTYQVVAPGGAFGDQPDKAGTNHVHGSLTMALRTELQLVRGQQAEIQTSTGTLQPNGTLKTYCCILPLECAPEVEVVFPAARADLDPITLRVKLLRQGCICHGHFARIEVPANIGKGKATITLSFPDWEYGEVAPAQFEIPIVEE